MSNDTKRDWKGELETFLKNSEKGRPMDLNWLRKFVRHECVRAKTSILKMSKQFKQVEGHCISQNIFYGIISRSRPLAHHYYPCLLHWLRQRLALLSPSVSVLGKRGREFDDHEETGRRYLAKKTAPFARPTGTSAAPAANVADIIIPVPATAAAAAVTASVALPDMYHVLLLDNGTDSVPMQRLAGVFSQWPGTVICPIYTQMDKKTMEDAFTLFLNSLKTYEVMLSRSTARPVRKHRIILCFAGKLEAVEKDSHRFMCTDGQGIPAADMISRLKHFYQFETFLFLDLHAVHRYRWPILNKATYLVTSTTDNARPLVLMGQLAHLCQRDRSPFSLTQLEQLAKEWHQHADDYFQLMYNS